MKSTKLHAFFFFSSFSFSPVYFPFYSKATFNPPQRSMMPKANTPQHVIASFFPRDQIF